MSASSIPSPWEPTSGRGHPMSGPDRFPWQRAATGANLLSADGTLGVTIFEEMTTLALKHRRHQPRPGLPGRGRPGRDQGGRPGRHRGRRQPVRARARASCRCGRRSPSTSSGSTGWTPDPETEIIVTTGATEAIAASLLALVGPGDEVLTFEPFYDSYGAIIGLSGARHVTAPLLAPDFMPDLDALEAAFSDRTKVVLVNNPHNPTGAVFPREVPAARRRTGREVRRRHHHRRGLRAPHLRCAAHPGGHAARRGRSAP